MSGVLHFEDEAARSAMADAGLRCYDDLAGMSAGVVVHERGSGVTRRVEIAGPGSVFVKWYRYAGGRSRFRFRRDAATIEARNYRILRERCRVAVPEVVCWGSRRRGLRLTGGVIVTREVVGAVPLDRFAADAVGASSEAVRSGVRAMLLDETADLVSRMHAGGFYHVDLQWRNLLVETRNGVAQRVVVIDSSRGGVRRTAVGRLHGQLRDLSSLAKDARRWLTAREQLRWLRRYFGTERMSAAQRAVVGAIREDRFSKDHSDGE